MEKWPKLMDGKACRLEKVFIKEEMRKDFKDKAF